MERKQLEKMALDKMSADMIFCFEMDPEEQAQAMESITSATNAELLAYLEEQADILRLLVYLDK